MGGSSAWLLPNPRFPAPSMKASHVTQVQVRRRTRCTPVSPAHLLFCEEAGRMVWGGEQRRVSSLFGANRVCLVRRKQRPALVACRPACVSLTSHDNARNRENPSPSSSLTGVLPGRNGMPRCLHSAASLGDPSSVASSNTSLSERWPTRPASAHALAQNLHRCL